MTFLQTIARSRLRRVEEARERVPVDVLRQRCACVPPALDVLERLAAWPEDRRAVIAEVKRKSPSKGELRADLEPAELAAAYEAAGALAISVLTEPDHFGGSLGDLEAVRSAVAIPILCKDFVVDAYQLWEARSRGADVVLLIAALLGGRLRDYLGLAREAGLEPLVEVHERGELDGALAAGARLVGINNRNLRTFGVDLAVSRDLLPRLPPGIAAVSESGLRTAGDLDELAGLGAKAFLIGEALVTAPAPGAALRGLVERRR